jgi:LPPG:FO 2-phospho-L-lactate transferase
LATHIERTQRLREGQMLSQITHDFCRAWGVRQPVLPMSDQSVRTMVDTMEDGELAFQEYFVHRKCEPKVKGFRFSGIKTARPAPGVLEAIEQAFAVVICPSNSWVSIDPILSIADLRSALAAKLVVAVSPIISEQTVKGPAAKMYTELGIQPSAQAVARHYGEILSGFVQDKVDANLAQIISIPILATNILMKNQGEQGKRRRLAEDVLNLIQTLRSAVP